MRGIDNQHREPIGVSRNVIKTTPNRVTALWLFGVFMVASVAFVGMWIGYFLFGGFTDVAYCFGFGVTLLVCSVVGWFTIIIQESSSEFKIKVVKEK
jgi:hypothetical protein